MEAPSVQKTNANAWNLQAVAEAIRGRTSNQATSLSQHELQQPGSRSSSSSSSSSFEKKIEIG